MRDRIERAEQSGLQEAERMAHILSTYQINLQATETKLAAAQQEAVDLHVQLSQIVKAGARSKSSRDGANAEHFSENARRDEEVSGRIPRGEDVATISTMMDEKYKVMFEAFSKQINQLQEQLVSTKRKNSAAEKIVSNEKSELIEAVAQAVQPSTTTIESKQSTANTNVMEEQFQVQLKAKDKKIRQLEEYIQALESGAQTAISKKLHGLEERAADLSSRNTALEEELHSYQAYMRNVIPQYKKQLQYLKSQLASTLQSSVGGGIKSIVREAREISNNVLPGNNSDYPVLSGSSSARGAMEGVRRPEGNAPTRSNSAKSRTQSRRNSGENPQNQDKSESGSAALPRDEETNGVPLKLPILN